MASCVCVYDDDFVAQKKVKRFGLVIFRKKIFLTQILCECFDLQKYWVSPKDLFTFCYPNNKKIINFFQMSDYVAVAVGSKLTVYNRWFIDCYLYTKIRLTIPKGIISVKWNGVFFCKKKDILIHAQIFHLSNYTHL